MTTTPNEAQSEEKPNPFRKAFTAQVIVKYMTDTNLAGPAKP